jgi:hypothetical protein
MKLFKGIEKWIDIRLGWFFVNGRKGEDWITYLKNKYGN